MEHDLARLLRFVADRAPVSLAKAGKGLGLAQSELLRLLAVLGNDGEAGGLGLVEQACEADGAGNGRILLRLTARGRDWLEQHR